MSSQAVQRWKIPVVCGNGILLVIEDGENRLQRVSDGLQHHHLLLICLKPSIPLIRLLQVPQTDVLFVLERIELRCHQVLFHCSDKDHLPELLLVGLLAGAPVFGILGDPFESGVCFSY